MVGRGYRPLASFAYIPDVINIFGKYNIYKNSYYKPTYYKIDQILFLCLMLLF